MKQFNEIFEEIRSAKRKHEKIDIMVKYGNADSNYPLARTFQALLMGNFHPGITFDALIPDYKPNEVPIGFGFVSFYDIIQRIYLLQNPNCVIKDLWRPHNPKIATLPADHKSGILKQMLEGLQKDDAAVLVNLVSKNFNKAYGITESMVREAFPNLLGPVS